MSKEVMKLALEALDCIYSPLHVREINKVGAAMAALREALAEQPAQHRAWFTVDELSAWADKKLKENPQWAEKPAQQALDKMAENARELGLDYEPAQQQKEGFASPGGGYVPAIPRPIPLDWKLVPRKATPKMLRAMDECAQEGYDERLYAGMASSVYMAAWDASPVMGTLPEQPAQQEPVAILHRYPSKCRMTVEYTDEITEVREGSWPLYTIPPQRKPLTDEEIILIVADCASSHQHTDIHFARAIERAHGIKELV